MDNHTITKQSFIHVQAPQQNHFNPVWAGNGYQHMNFYIRSAIVNNNELSAGDEIAIFDGEYCVGMVKLNNQILQYPNQIVPVVCSHDDPMTPETDGYTIGNQVMFKIWKNNQMHEYSDTQITTTYIQGTDTFQIGTTSVVDLYVGGPVSYQVTGTVSPEGAGVINGIGSYLPGDMVQLSVYTAPNYRFIHWTDESGQYISRANPFVFTMPAENRQFIAHFMPVSISNHFIPVWTEMPVNYMTFNVSSAYFDGRQAQAGDEIAIFDGDLCVGSIRLTQSITDSVSFIAAMDDPNTLETDGFIAGNPLVFKTWDDVNGIEISGQDLIVSYIYGGPDFQPATSAHVQLSSYQTSYFVLDLSVDPLFTGTVYGAGIYEAGQEITVEAYPFENYQFSHWSYNNLMVSDSVFYTFTLNQNMLLTAHFTPIINQPPVLDLPAELTILEDQPQWIDFSPYLSDPDNDISQLTITGFPTANIDIQVYGHEVWLYPSTDWSGSETIHFMVDDGVYRQTSRSSKAINSASTLLNVIPINDAPYVTNYMEPIEFYEDTVFFGTNLNSFFYDADLPYGDHLSFSTGEYDGINIQILNGEFSIIPEPDWQGSHWVEFTATDDSLQSISIGVNVTVINTNDAPSIDLPAEFVGLEDQVLAIDFSPYLSDKDNSIWDLQIFASNTEHISVSIYGQTVYFSPAENWSGTESFQFYVNDYVDSSARVKHTRATATDNVDVTFLPVNDAPYITQYSEYINLDEDTQLTGLNLNNYFADYDLAYGDHLTISTPNDYEGIDIQIEQGIVTITPQPNWYGYHWVEFTATDDSLSSVIMGAYVIINNVNDAPVLNMPAEFVGLEDNEIWIDMYQYTSDIDNEDWQLSFTSSSSEHLYTYTSGQYIVISPAMNWSGTESIQITANDGIDRSKLKKIGRATDTTTISVTIQPMNDAPYITQYFDSIAFDEDTQFTGLNLNNYFSDYDLPYGDQLTFSTSNNYEGIDIQILQGIVTITPQPDWYGYQSVEIIATDDSLASISMNIDVTVNNVNDAPVLNMPAEFVGLEDNEVWIYMPDYTSDKDNAQWELTYISTSSEHLNTYTSGDYIVVSPTVNWSGTESIQITVSDGVERNTRKRTDRATDTAIISVTILPMNDAPFMTQYIPEIVFDEDTQFNGLNLNNYFSDHDLPYSDHLTFSTLNNYEGIDILINEGIVSITPQPNWFGQHWIEFTATDDSLVSISMGVNVTVNNVNDAPALNLPAVFTGLEDNEIWIDMYQYTTDIDNEFWQMSFTSSISEHLNTYTSGQYIVISPAVNWSGTESIQITANDGVDRNSRKRINRATDTATITVTILPMNDTPYITQDLPGITFDEDTLYSGLNLNNHFSDYDLPYGDQLVYSTPNNYEGIDIQINQGIVSVTPQPNWFGQHWIEVTATDDSLASISMGVYVNVISVNDAPVINFPETISMNEDEPLMVDLSPYINDIDTPLEWIAMSAVSTDHLNIEVMGHSLYLMPALNWHGSEVINVSVDDGYNTNLITFSQNIRRENDKSRRMRDVVTGQINIIVNPVADDLVFDLPDMTSFDEDSTFVMNLAELISNIDEHTLGITVHENQYLSYEMNDMMMTLTPQPNWFGSTWLTITVTELNVRMSVTDSMLVQVNPVNDAPVITSAQPDSTIIHTMTLIENLFAVTASDIDNEELFYQWMINDQTADSDSSSFMAIFDQEGVYSVKVYVSDGQEIIFREWQVNVIPNATDSYMIPVTCLKQNYPNPFNPTTTIEYELKKADHVRIDIFNIKGQIVKTLVNENCKSGRYSITWNGKDMQNRPVSSGVYFYRMQTKDYAKMHKMLMMK